MFNAHRSHLSGMALFRGFVSNVKPGPPPVAVPERSDGASTGGRAEALVGRFIGSGKRNVVCPLFFSTPSR
jgi:hypothetical protein